VRYLLSLLQLKVPSWVPGMVVAFLEKKAVSEANVWLRRESEEKFAKV
jgi:hypothetical protein